MRSCFTWLILFALLHSASVLASTAAPEDSVHSKAIEATAAARSKPFRGKLWVCTGECTYLIGTAHGGRVPFRINKNKKKCNHTIETRSDDKTEALNQLKSRLASECYFKSPCKGDLDQIEARATQLHLSGDPNAKDAVNIETTQSFDCKLVGK